MKGGPHDGLASFSSGIGADINYNIDTQPLHPFAVAMVSPAWCSQPQKSGKQKAMTLLRTGCIDRRLEGDDQRFLQVLQMRCTRFKQGYPLGPKYLRTYQCASRSSP